VSPSTPCTPRLPALHDSLHSTTPCTPRLPLLRDSHSFRTQELVPVYGKYNSPGRRLGLLSSLSHNFFDNFTMWPPITLPFLRDSISLPSPLLTESDIENSTMILRYDPNYHKVMVVGQYFLIKYGRGVEQREGDTLYFIEHNLRISAPRLYVMYRKRATAGSTLLWSSCRDSLWTKFLVFSQVA
jgi:hypothetical protein